MSRRRNLAARALAALLVACLAPRPAAADDPPLRTLGIGVSDAGLRATFGFRDVFSPSIRDRLRSGLPTRIVLQISLEREGKGKPVAYFAQTSQIVYDLWEEAFYVAIEDERGRRRARAESLERALDLAGVLRRVKVASLAGLEPGNYRLRVLAEVNPVSAEMVENIRRWLARPEGAGSGSGQGNFFGSFVGIFVDRNIGEADKSVVFISQWFEIKASP
ncbi:MAG: DUF4390 domain-containing protein [Deltaproteobacteria bacterium]|nr:DUF4390 domain-containing protein [Deltaproteobacteria bacterium]